jgi:hypothetical protein
MPLPGFAAPLLGCWTLVGWSGVVGSGRRVEHGGAQPSGVLIYLPSARMAVQIQHDDRARFGSKDLDAGTEALQAAAYRTYIAYAGRFSVPEAGVVVHHVEQALHPDQLGMDKRRAYELDGEELVLHTQDVITDGEPATSALRWRRMD